MKDDFHSFRYLLKSSSNESKNKPKYRRIDNSSTFTNQHQLMFLLKWTILEIREHLGEKFQLFRKVVRMLLEYSKGVRSRKQLRSGEYTPELRENAIRIPVLWMYLEQNTRDSNTKNIIEEGSDHTGT